MESTYGLVCQTKNNITVIRFLSITFVLGILEQVSMTSSSTRVFTDVLAVEPPCTNHLQSSTQGVVGQHSMKDFLEP